MPITRHALAASLALIMAAGGSATPVWAQDVSGFRLEALNGICSDVRTENYQRYQNKIVEAAGVQSGDTEAERRARTAALFSQFMPHCEGFNVRRGNILKYAVNQNASAFIYAAINDWDADLDQVDAADGRTVLDYVINEIVKNRGTSQEAVFDLYRAVLVRGGARTRAQAEAEGRTYPGIPSIAELAAQVRQ
ncbi:hypothetical protein [Brevundimonas sp.]|uniref:hypothetical protein n=1 Tax=Brevundimonas sp. TaxID=1871086 RepID=UPI00261A2D9F|nr:hypothetical protein [Brevundimonas sp.]